MKRNKLTIPAPSEPVIFKDKYGAEMHIAAAGGGRVLFEIHDGDDVGTFEIDGLEIIPIFTDTVKATGLSAIIYEANNLYAYPWEVDDALEGIWVTLQAGARALTGHTFDQVLEANLAKLADRQARGVIGGSGDDR